jgi:hypothetical protein
MDVRFRDNVPEACALRSVLKLLDASSNTNKLDNFFLESDNLLYETKGGEYQRNFIFKTLDGKNFKIIIISRKAASLKREKDDSILNINGNYLIYKENDLFG